MLFFFMAGDPFSPPLRSSTRPSPLDWDSQKLASRWESELDQHHTMVPGVRHGPRMMSGRFIVLQASSLCRRNRAATVVDCEILMAGCDSSEIPN